ncbi:MAG: hypothetical protein KBG86_09790, partial [Flavobacteriales bacterium]|nr:hypothetical protein [Flavobacteriales bacterium]
MTELKRVIFEFAPKERFTNDNSAFDIAFEVTIGDKSGLIGLECKYTDTFSSTEYDKPAYKEIFEKSRSFSANYESLKASRYNQLFRNQLIAEGLIQNNKYDFVRTGLFCYEQDSSAIETGQELQQMLSKPDSFQIITYRNFIENVQQLSLDWQKREWTMLLWARYCGTVLSEPIYQELQKLIVLHSDNQNNDTQFFKLAIELERQFQDELIKNEIHFRASLNSLSLISVGTDKPELGVPCKNHNQWTAEILRTYIEKIKSKPAPKRPTPEKSLQAWIIKEAQANDHKLPFDNSIKFITSELAMHNYSGDKVVSDIIGYDTSTNQLIIIELKSDRLLKRLIEQVDSFGEIIHDNFWFFHDLVTLHGFGKLEEVTRKAIVWPHEKTSPLEKLKELDIAEYTYQESNGSYNFIDHSKNETHRFAHLTKFDIEA